MFTQGAITTTLSLRSILTVLLTMCWIMPAQANWQSAVSDEALRACIQQALDKAGVPPEQLTKLKCHSKKIEQLDGIEQFIGLTSLSLFNNRIKAADLSPLKQLTLVNLAKNKLTSLTVANLNALQSLYAFQNKLETVDLTGLTALQKLRLAQNKITHLNTQDLVALESAHLFDNQMEDLDITPMVSLTFMDVKQNPMPDALYDFFDEQKGIVISHDGNADDWK